MPLLFGSNLPRVYSQQQGSSGTAYPREEDLLMLGHMTITGGQAPIPPIHYNLPITHVDNMSLYDCGRSWSQAQTNWLLPLARS